MPTPSGPPHSLVYTYTDYAVEMQIKFLILAITLALATLCMAADAHAEKRNVAGRQPVLEKRKLPL